VYVAGCGGSIHAQEGNISSPNYPANYNDSIECVWDIAAANGYHIISTFQSPFDLEGIIGCRNDFVEVNFQSIALCEWNEIFQNC